MERGRRHRLELLARVLELAGHGEVRRQQLAEVEDGVREDGHGERVELYVEEREVDAVDRLYAQVRERALAEAAAVGKAVYEQDRDGVASQEIEAVVSELQECFA